MRTTCAFPWIVGDVILALIRRRLAQTLPATTSVQIVNATSVPAIALRINDRIAYDNFPQGLKTADSPASLLKAVYEAEDRQTGSRATSAKIDLRAGHESIAGDPRRFFHRYSAWGAPASRPGSHGGR